MKHLICTVCPKGCHLNIDEKTNAVTGNACPRGEAYGVAELTAPTRTLTTTAVVVGGAAPRCSVKSAAPLPKDKLFDCMEQISALRLTAPVHIGDLLIGDVCGTGVAIVATCSVTQNKS